MPTIIGRAQYYGGDWLDWVGRYGLVAGRRGGGVLAASFAIWLVVQRMIVASARIDSSGMPSFFDRISSAAMVAPARMLAPMAAAVLLYVGFDGLDLLFSPWERSAETALQGVLIYIAGSVLASVALTPRQPQWRLIPVDDQTASRLLLFVKAILAVYIVDTVLVEFGRAIYVPLVVTVAQSFITNIATAGLLAGLLLTPFVPQTGPLRAVNGLDRLNIDPVSRHAPAVDQATLVAADIGDHRHLASWLRGARPFHRAADRPDRHGAGDRGIVLPRRSRGDAGTMRRAQPRRGCARKPVRHRERAPAADRQAVRNRWQFSACLARACRC